MKSCKNIVLGLMLCCTIPTHINTKQDSTPADDTNQSLKKEVNRYEPLEIDFKKIINPSVVAVANQSELEQPIAKIPQTDKKAKYDSDAALRATLSDHAQGLSEGKIFNAKETLDFFNSNIHEQKEHVLKWLRKHNSFQRDQLKKAQHKYHKEVAKFKSTTQQQAMETVQKIEDEMKTRKHKIETLSNKLEKLDENSMDYSQKEAEIARLKKQNSIDQASIQKQLLMVLSKLDELDANFKNECHGVIENYQDKNHELLNTVNGIVKSKKQAFGLKTPKKKEPKKAEPKPKKLKKAEQPVEQNPDSVILSEPIAALAGNPILNSIVEQRHKDIAATSKSSDEYSILKQELAHLKKAQHYRDSHS
ncbi:hypothetical protein A3J41_00690 [candidate division TM6 bacterium RIFCSPHIGHO2_12_FULL_38_8]|nr:MAG: hypothetical protein A3J41_00690 [candidate division TM6 bacterium RIFCSPHIGHO2_12_FULL_38_8]